MGVLASKRPQQAQILMLGLDGAGKSTLLYKLKHNESVVTVPTVGFNVELLGTEARGPELTLWDVGGQRRMRPHWRHHYAGTACLVFVVDSWDLRRLDKACKELHEVLRCQSLERVPLVVLANKQDLPGAVSPEQLTRRLDLRRVCGIRYWFVQLCSALTGVGLEDGFRRVAYMLKTPLKLTKEHIKDTVQELSLKPWLKCP